MAETSPARPRRRWRRRLVGVIGTLVVLAAAGLVVADVLEWPDRIPSDDLFGGSRPTSPRPTTSPTPPPGADIAGPLDILLVGIDPRAGQPEWVPHADAVLILHVTETLDRAYLVSLPRDLIVDIPAFADADFGGGTFRLLSAMSHGSRVPGEPLPDRAQGFALLAETVRDYTGIERFDAGAVLNFPGFTDLVDALGGVEMWLNMRVASEHRQPDGSHRPLQPGGGGYLGPQQVYEPGRHHLEGWQALDIARQRYLPGGDYTRQRHQRQLIRALVDEIVSQDLATNPVELDRVLQAMGDALVFDGRGQEVVDFAFALHRLRADAIVPVGLPGRPVYHGPSYEGEQLEPIGEEFLAAVAEDRVAPFLAEHPELVDEPPDGGP